MNEVINIIYIVSPNYSGSTLLNYLMAQHPSVGTIGERKAFWRKVFVDHPIGSTYCSCGESFSNCKFWQSLKATVSEQVDKRILAVNFSAFHYYERIFPEKITTKLLTYALERGKLNQFPPILKKRYLEILSANYLLINAVLKQSGATVFLDSSKNPKHSVLLDSHQQLRVKVIRLYRDGRAYLYSCLKRNHGKSIENICQEWVSSIKRTDEIFAAGNIEIAEVNYEMLCNNPYETLKFLYIFAGLDSDAINIEFSPTEQHIMGNNEMRFNNYVKISNKNEWRYKLSSKDLSIFYKIAGNLNHSLGYFDE